MNVFDIKIISIYFSSVYLVISMIQCVSIIKNIEYIENQTCIAFNNINIFQFLLKKIVCKNIFLDRVKQIMLLCDKQSEDFIFNDLSKKRYIKTV